MRSFIHLVVFVALSLLGTCHGSVAHDKAREGDVAFFSDDFSRVALNERETRSGQTPLMAASLAGKHLVVDRLLTLGADPTIAEKDGYNPPHGVAFQGRADATTVLIQHGVPVDDAHEDGYTPLHRTVWGMRQRHIDTARVLVRDGGADPDGLDSDGLPPSHRAASRGWKEMVEALLELGADATLQAGESGDTLLHVAVRSQSVELVGAVLRGGGDAGAKNAKGTTARGLAKTLPSTDIRKLLSGASQGAGDVDGEL